MATGLTYLCVRSTQAHRRGITAIFEHEDPFSAMGQSLARSCPDFMLRSSCGISYRSSGRRIRNKVNCWWDEMVAGSRCQWVRCRVFAFSRDNLIYAYSRVDGEWIVAKKDWQEAKRRERSKEHRDKSKERAQSAQQPNATDSNSAEDTSEPCYTPDMDEQRCILYFHGGKPSFLSTLFFCFPTRSFLRLFRRWILLRQRGPRAIQYPTFRSENERACVW